MKRQSSLKSGRARYLSATDCCLTDERRPRLTSSAPISPPRWAYPSGRCAASCRPFRLGLPSAWPQGVVHARPSANDQESHGLPLTNHPATPSITREVRSVSAPRSSASPSSAQERVRLVTQRPPPKPRCGDTSRPQNLGRHRSWSNRTAGSRRIGVTVFGARIRVLRLFPGQSELLLTGSGQGAVDRPAYRRQVEDGGQSVRISREAGARQPAGPTRQLP